MDRKIIILKAGDKKHHFTEADLPALIHYKAKEGGSNYSMILIANLVLKGSKAIILTGYPEAKEQFYQDTKAVAEHIVEVHTLSELKNNQDKHVIVIHDDDEKLCLEAIKMFKDIHERVIFIKNVDIFHKQLLNTCLKYTKLILSGDLDACIAKGNVSKKKYNSIILFSQPKTKLPYTFLPVEQYIGYIRSKKTKGYVKSTQYTK